MNSTRSRTAAPPKRPFLMAAVASILFCPPVLAANQNDVSRWIGGTASAQPQGFSRGDPLTLTWSIVPDSTTIFGAAGEPTSGSGLVALLDAELGSGPGGTDLTLRPWFSRFSDSFNRFSEVAGLTYLYEPNDDGNTVGGIAPVSPFGSLGVRGDVRIGGHPVDGQSDTNILAYNYFPNNGDMVLDTDNSNLFGGSNSLAFRNVIMHELAHGLGLRHVISTGTGGGSFLLEPNLSTAFDGPQFNDILLLHRGYGDVNEKSNAGLGNDTSALATDLGAIVSGGTISIGNDARDLVVGATEVDFVSIDDTTDTDFFSFTVSDAGTIDVLVEALGPTYNAGPQGVQGNPNPPQDSFDASMRSDLTLTIFDVDGTTPLATINNGGLGDDELASAIALSAAGTYFARVTGVDNPDGLQIDTQFFGLTINFNASLGASPVPEPATAGLFAIGLVISLFARRRTA